MLTADGEPCTTAEALTDRWIEFFGEMEGGERVDATTQRRLWQEGLKDAIAEEIDLPLHYQPSSTLKQLSDM